MTMGSGFATTFALLFMLRLGLGIGEAVVSPASVSIISDYFNRKERARAISLFMAGPYLGAGLAFLGGGLVVKRSEEHTSELQSLMRISYAVFCLKTKNDIKQHKTQNIEA